MFDRSSTLDSAGLAWCVLDSTRLQRAGIPTIPVKFLIKSWWALTTPGPAAPPHSKWLWQCKHRYLKSARCPCFVSCSVMLILRVLMIYIALWPTRLFDLWHWNLKCSPSLWSDCGMLDMGTGVMLFIQLTDFTVIRYLCSFFSWMAKRLPGNVQHICSAFYATVWS